MAFLAIAIPALGGLTVGSAISIAATVAGMAYEMLSAPHANKPTFTAMNSAWGNTWPIAYNSFRIAGNVIQAGPVTANKSKKFISKNTPDYTQTVAFGFCEGVRKIGRIWADNQVIYDPRPIVPPPVWTPNTIYGAGDIVMATATPNGPDQFTASNDGESGATEPDWSTAQYGLTRDDTIAWITTEYFRRTWVGRKYQYTIRIYEGTETQLPDPALEELVGSGFQPAYRGLVNVVLEQFGLTKYGSRIPNIEAEILANAVIEGTDLYGHQIGANAGQLLQDDDGTLYSVTDQNYIVNIKTQAAVHKSGATIQADAVALGYSGAQSTWVLWALVGKYFIGISENLGTPSIDVILYEINTDGSVTAIGAKSYTVSGLILPSPVAVTVRPDTGEIMFAYGSGSSFSLSVFLADKISGLTGGWALRPLANRVAAIGEIAGNYGAFPGPYSPDGQMNTISFVGADLYIALNKAVMDFHASHAAPAFGWCAFYASLQPQFPYGALLKVSLSSDGVTGNITYIYEGISGDFPWPFADEGSNKSGAAGQTGAPTYDCWSAPVAQQATDGTVAAVYFARGYSDATIYCGVKKFLPVADSFELSTELYGSPFTTAFLFTVSVPRAMFFGDEQFLWFTSGGVYYALIGTLAGELTLADVCADISGRIGLTPSDYDYSGLGGVVPTGCALLDRSPARSFLEALQPAFFFDLTDIGAKIVGTLRSEGSLLLSIPEDDLGASTDPATIVDRISTTRNDDVEIPKDFSVSYYDVLNQYEQGSQNSKRNEVTQFSSGRNTIPVPVVMTAQDAANAAQRMLYMLWIERETKKFSVPLDYVGLTPADVIEAQRAGRNHILRITKATLDPTMVIKCEGVSEDFGVYSLIAPASVVSGGGGGEGSQIVDPFLAVLDTATLQASDLQQPGVYVAGCPKVFGGGWDIEVVQESTDDSNWTTVDTLTGESTIGTARTVLGSCARWTVWDRVNTLDVALISGVLGSATEDDVVNNFANTAWLSSGEIVQFATVEFLGGSSYRLSDLLRGRLGTEQFIGAAAGGNVFVMLNSQTMGDVDYSASDIGATRYWQGLNDGLPSGSSGVQKLVMATRRLLPYAPYFINGSRDMGGDLTITGIRRMRWRGRPLWRPPETDSPVAMQVDILNGSTVVRTLSSTLSANGSGITDASAFEAYYAELDQVADFGSPQDSVSVKAYEMNAIIGRGYGGSATV